MLRLINVLKGVYKGTRIILFGTRYYCNYVPSCSEYAINALKNERLWKVPYLVFCRLISCSFVTIRNIYNG